MIDAIYCRVSTDEQKSNTSLDEQEARCREYLNRVYPNSNIKAFREDHSGFEYDRPVLDEIKELMSNGKVRSFTVLRVDRLCRKVSVLEKIRDEFFKPLGVDVHSLDLGLWQWNPSHESMQEQYALMASNWGKMAVLAMQEGRMAHVKSGNVICGGLPPLGFIEQVTRNEKGKRTGGKLIPDPKEAQIVVRIYENLVSDSMSLYEIASTLNSDAIPTFTQLREFTPFKEKQAEKSRSPHQWRSSTVRQIIRNEVYSGRWYFGKRKTVKLRQDGKIIKKKITTDKNLIEVTVPELVPLHIWNEAQKILDKNKVEKSGQPVKYQYLLAKRLKCSCGYSLKTHAKEAGKYRYYRCPSSHVSVKAQIAEDHAWQWLFALLSNKDLLKSKIENYLEEQEKVIRPLQQRLDLLEKILKRKHKEHDTRIKSFWRLPELAQAKAALDMEQLETEIKELESEQGEIKGSIDQVRSSSQDMLEFVEYLIREGHSHKEPGFFDGPMMFPDFDNDLAYQLVKPDEVLSYDDKLKYVVQFDLRGILFKEDGQLKLHVQCAIGSDILSLNSTVYDEVTQSKKKFRLVFSDVLILDLRQLQAVY